MKIRTFIDLINQLYHVEVQITDLSAYEKEVISNFGEPEINVGGTFVGSVTRPGETAKTIEFLIPNRYLRVSDFPYKQFFDLRDTPDADLQAKLFADTIANRITSAKIKLLNNVPSFEGETVTTI